MEELTQLSLLDNSRGVWLLELKGPRNDRGERENRFDPNLLGEIANALDVIERSDGPCALVITAAREQNGKESKFFSNGHDVRWLEETAKSEGTQPGSPAAKFIDKFYELLARFMTAPFVTVAAINGHAFAGGCLLALAQDYRVMHAGKGFICMNEIDMLLAVSPQQASESHVKPGAFHMADAKMTSILLAKLSTGLVRDMFLSGKRYSGVEALEAGIVHAVADSHDAVIHHAKEIASQFSGKAIPSNRRTISVLKTELVRNFLPLLQNKVLSEL